MPGLSSRLSTYRPTKLSNKWWCSQHTTADQTLTPCVYEERTSLAWASKPVSAATPGLGTSVIKSQRSSNPQPPPLSSLPCRSSTSPTTTSAVACRRDSPASLSIVSSSRRSAPSLVVASATWPVVALHSLRNRTPSPTSASDPSCRGEYALSCFLTYAVFLRQPLSRLSPWKHRHRLANRCIIWSESKDW